MRGEPILRHPRVVDQLGDARDNQKRHQWRGMIGDIGRREDELGGKTLVIVGLGRIGSRLATLARAFDMKVIGVKRDPAAGGGAADVVVANERLCEVLADADYLALTCPLTPATEKLIDGRALRAMKPSSFLINVARGRVVDEAALIDALRERRIAGAALDCVENEPLPDASPLWDMDNVLDILIDNLERIWRGEPSLRNQIA